MFRPALHGAVLPLLLLAFSALTSANPLPYADPAPIAAPWPQPSQTYDQTSDYGGSATTDTEGGASGDSSSFKIGTGGIIAIGVVVGLVVILGIASTILFYIAKKRQWDVRKSISRASRRVTGKFTGKAVPTREEEARRSRRQGAVRVAGSQTLAQRHEEKAGRSDKAKVQMKAVEMTSTVPESAAGAGAGAGSGLGRFETRGMESGRAAGGRR